MGKESRDESKGFLSPMDVIQYCRIKLHMDCLFLWNNDDWFMRMMQDIVTNTS